MKEKLQVITYRCNKCGFQKDFISNQQINTKCKVCGNEMIFCNSRNYNPKNGLRAVKNSNKANTKIDTHVNNSTVTCPYCHSVNTKKITTTSKVVNTALFGIFGQKRRYQWHCNNCKSDF